MGVFLSSFGSTANPQMFALAREHADHTGREAVMFSSYCVLRCRWLGDWPAAGLRAGDGFWLYGDVPERGRGVCGLRRDGVVLSAVNAQRAQSGDGSLEARAVTVAMRCCFIICTLMWGTNSLYIINMPLFIIDELHLPEKAGRHNDGHRRRLEIPTMLIAGYYAKRFGKRFLMRIAAVAGLLFYVVC